MAQTVNVRELIYAALLSITRDGAYSHIVLQDTLNKYQYLSKQERSFFTRECQGTLEHMLWIDSVIDRFSKVKGSKMKPQIRTILRSSVYELLYMDSVPASATCNEAVKLAKKKGFSSLGGFVNGVLRSIEREKDAPSLPNPETSPMEYLSLNYSMPIWILNLWKDRYSREELEEMLSAFQTEAPTAIRVNTRQITPEQLKAQLEKEGAKVEEVANLPEAFFLSDYDYLEALPSFRQGLFYVQDLSSMEVGRLINPAPEARCLDVCAAPGGKSIHLAQLLKETGFVEARDLTEKKVALIRENSKRCGLTNLEAKVADATVFYPEDEEAADVVLADVPCSGLGVLGKKPDIKYRITLEETKALARLQRQILDTVCRYVKPGGKLLYSTCTVNPMENEENVADVLD